MNIAIKVNGETQEISNHETLADLLQSLALTPNTFAIAVNGEFIAKSNYQHTIISENDAIEVVSAMQGG